MGILGDVAWWPVVGFCEAEDGSVGMIMSEFSTLSVFSVVSLFSVFSVVSLLGGSTGVSWIIVGSG